MGNASAADQQPAVVGKLRTAIAEYKQAQQAIDRRGRENLQELQEAYEEATTLLAAYEDRATDTGIQEFMNFAEFKRQFETLVTEIDPALPASDAFDHAYEAIDKRRLSTSDFEAARDALEPVRSELALFEDEQTARDKVLAAKQHAQQRREKLTAEIDRLEDLVRFENVTFDAPIEELNEPIETYNTAVQAAFQQWRQEKPVRDVFALLERAEYYPLVSFEKPPTALTEFLAETSAGDRPIAELLELATYSRSKLTHYVENPRAFKREIASARTYLQELDATPLTIAWPPPPAAMVPWRTRALRAVCGRMLTEETIAQLRTIEALAREDRYERLRRVAMATERLDADQRAKLQSGELAAELDAKRADRETIDTALDELPDM